MRTRILIDEIQTLMETINEQFEIINSYEEKIPQIEIDIMMENVRKVYSNLQLITRTNDPSSEVDLKLPETKPIVQPEPAKSRPGEIEESKMVAGEPAVAFRSNHEPENQFSQNKASKSAQREDLDLFSTETSGFSGKLQEARQQNIPKPRKSRSQDLKSLISINEKFLFINELFDGNLGEYNENIESLGRFMEIRAAMEHLDLLRKKNLWNSESIAFIKLKEILENRFR